MAAELLERLKSSEFLGREFLAWLWYKSETDGGRFDLGDAGKVELHLDRRLVLESDGDQGRERVVCSGLNPHLKEARFALAEDKQLTEAMVRMILGDQEWYFTLDSTWMNFKSFKTPKIMQDMEKDPDGFFYEKMYLIDQAVSAMDAVFSLFVKLRFSAEWEQDELPSLRNWIMEGR